MQADGEPAFDHYGLEGKDRPPIAADWPADISRPDRTVRSRAAHFEHLLLSSEPHGFCMEPLDPDTGVSMTSPLPYALITTVDREGRSNAMGASWVTRVSFKPFLMMVSVGKQRLSHRSIHEQGEFVICYPSAEQEKGALYCGTHPGHAGDKIARAGLVAVPSTKVRPPTIGDCTVAFECKVTCEYDAGDHTLFVGEVVAVTGDLNRAKHLFVTTRSKMVAMDQNGNV